MLTLSTSISVGQTAEIAAAEQEVRSAAAVDQVVAAIAEDEIDVVAEGDRVALPVAEHGPAAENRPRPDHVGNP